MTVESLGPATKLASIQYLRGFAALGVLAFHAVGVAGGQFAIGTYGVQLFLVISGFIMVWITDEQSRPLPFLKDRMRRIVPLYWLATASWVILTSLIDGAFEYRPENLALSLLFFPHGDPDLGWHYFPVLDVGWSLNLEVLFYALMAAALLLPLRWRLWAITGALVGLVAAGKTLQPSSAPLEFWTHSIILHFLAGAWLAEAFKVKSTALSRGVASTMVVLISVCVSSTALAVLLVAGGLTLERRGSMPKTRLLLLGDASYSIYLFHTTGILICAAVASKLMMPAPLVAAAAMIGGLAAGLVAYWLMERPMQGALLRRSRVSQTK